MYILELEEFWIGSRKNLHGHWIWDANDGTLSSNIFFHNFTTTLKYRNRIADNDFHCLALFRRHHHTPMLIPRRCLEQKPFICEKGNVKMIDKSAGTNNYNFQ